MISYIFYTRLIEIWVHWLNSIIQAWYQDVIRRTSAPYCCIYNISPSPLLSDQRNPIIFTTGYKIVVSFHQFRSQKYQVLTQVTLPIMMIMRKTANYRVIGLSRTLSLYFACKLQVVTCRQKLVLVRHICVSIEIFKRKKVNIWW